MKPVVTAVNVKGACRSKLRVSWPPHVQQELRIRHYSLTVASAATKAILASENVEVDNEKVEYCESIHVPSLYKHGEVVVNVIARTDRQDISSLDFPKSCRNGQWYLQCAMEIIRDN